MTLKRRITQLEDEMEDLRRPVPAIIFMDGTIMHRGREITREEFLQLPTDSQGIRAVDFRPA
jgi:putative N-acetylmannosamine-6-phosphate epimerase